MTKNQRRVVEISKKLKLAHIGSCLSVLPILEEIYAHKKKKDLVILDNAHAHLSHLVVRENYEEIDTEKLIRQDIHCNREAGCDALGGSLGHGIGIALGLAIADPLKTVHCIVSDGSMQEGSNWEALRLKKHLNVENLIIHVNLNGFTAVAEIDRDELAHRIYAFCQGAHIWYTENTPKFDGVKGHYITI